MVYFSIVVLWVVLPPFASLGACLLKYWTRGRLDYEPTNWLKVRLWDKSDDNLVVEYYLLCHLLFPAIILVCTSWLMVHHPVLTILSLLCIGCFIFLPRYACDIINSLKFNFKKADSERLLELEEEIRKLKIK